MATSPFLELTGSPITQTNTVTPFYKLLPTPSQPLPTSTNILSGLADARTNGVADDRSWSEKLAQFMTTPGILLDLVKEDSTTPSNPPSLIVAPPKTPKETVAEKAAKTNQQIANQKQPQQQAAQPQTTSPVASLVDVAKGFSGQSKPGDIQTQQQTPTTPEETPTGLAAIFADPRVQQALLGFGTALSNNAAGGQAVAAGVGQAFQEQVRQASIKAATEEKQYQRSQDELKNKREDRKVLNDEEKTKIDQQRADSLAKLQKAQADAAASGVEVDKARIRYLNTSTSKIYKDMKDGKDPAKILSDKDYAKMLTDLSYNLDDPESARYQLNDALPEGARRYATFTEEARQKYISEISGLDLTTPEGKRQAASIANRYSLIYGNVSPE